MKLLLNILMNILGTELNSFRGVQFVLCLHIDEVILNHLVIRFIPKTIRERRDRRLQDNVAFLKSQ